MVARKTAVITGAAGFLGGAVARYLRAAGWRIIGVDCIPVPTGEICQEAWQCDLNSESLSERLSQARPDCLLHFAGRAEVGQSFQAPLEDFLSGPALFARLLDAVRHAAPETKVVLASSAAVYGQPSRLPVNEEATIAPLSPYGHHKWMAELLAREYHEVYGIPVVALRIFSAYGAGLRKQLLWDLCRRCQQGEVILSGTGEETRDFIHGADIAQAVRCVAEHASFKAETYNVASGLATAIRHVGELVVAEFGLPPSCLSFSGQTRSGDPRFWRADIGRVQRLGFAPSVPLERGIADYVRWFKAETQGRPWSVVRSP